MLSCRSNYTPKDEGGIPTGEVSPVEGTPFDFTESRRIGNSIDQVEGGYDHNYILFGMGKNAKFATTVGAAALQCDSAPGNAAIIFFALRPHKQGQIVARVPDVAHGQQPWQLSSPEIVL